MKKFIIFVSIAYSLPIFCMDNNSSTDQDLDFVGALQPVLRKALKNDEWIRNQRLREGVRALDRKQSHLYSQATENNYQVIVRLSHEDTKCLFTDIECIQKELRVDSFCSKIPTYILEDKQFFILNDVESKAAAAMVYAFFKQGN